MAIMDNGGRIVEAGVEGELVTRGYSTMLGYWDDKEKTAEVCIQIMDWKSQMDLEIMREVEIMKSYKIGSINRLTSIKHVFMFLMVKSKTLKNCEPS